MKWSSFWQVIGSIHLFKPLSQPGESQGQEEPSGLLSMGSHRVGHDWSDLAAAAAAEYIKQGEIEQKLDVYPMINIKDKRKNKHIKWRKELEGKWERG